MKPSAQNPRVVVIPGLLGSALADTSISKPDAEALCAKHWEAMERWRDDLRSRGNVLCGDESNSIWGRAAFLHWLADFDGWLDLMTSGNGYKDAGVVRATSPTELIIHRGRGSDPWQSIPYFKLIQKLEYAGASVLQFPYDWRLSASVAVRQLQDAILNEWFGGKVPSSKPGEQKRVMLVGHSLGGLIARLFIEDPRTCGSLVVRHAVLVGVPHKGAPNAFGHFTGAKKFLPDPSLSSTWVTCEDAAAATAPAALSASIASKNLNRLVEHHSSIIQLFPRYDFVEAPGNPKKKEKYTETFKPITHKPSGEAALDILGEMSALLREPASLEYWLIRNDITYDIVSTIDLPTNDGMRRARNSSGFIMTLNKTGGDGTVPTFSSVGWLGDVDKLVPITRTDLQPNAKYRKHPQMCQNAEVQQLCVSRLKLRPQHKGASDRMGRGDVPQFLKIARDIFLAGREPFPKRSTMKSRTMVICFALIQGAQKDKPLFDPATHELDGKTRLVKDLKGIDSTRIVYEGNTGRTKYRFVELSPISSTGSGVVFLPATDEDFVHVFGIVATRWDPLDKKGHAEKQVQNFLDAQRRERDWQGAIQDIFFWNESLTRPGGGFSPCADCCDSLATMWCPDELQARHMEWNEVYEGADYSKKNRTTKASLGLMEKAKPTPWTLTRSPWPMT